MRHWQGLCQDIGRVYAETLAGFMPRHRQGLCRDISRVYDETTSNLGAQHSYAARAVGSYRVLQGCGRGSW